MSENHRADAVFALADLPATAFVDPELPEWRAGLVARGIEVLDDVAEVGVGRRVPKATSRSVIVDGRPARGALMRRGYSAVKLLTLPPSGSPAYIFPASAPRAMSYALRNVIASPPGIRGARNAAVARISAAGVIPWVPRAITVASNVSGPPAVIENARALGAPTDADWFLVVAPGSITRRCTFVLFEHLSRRPAFALKFARVPGINIQFERDESGLALAAAAGGPVAAHAPRWLGRCDLAGREDSLETAAAGVVLTNVISNAQSRAERLAAAEVGARWLLEVATHTASRGSLQPECDRLERQILPQWQGHPLLPGVDPLRDLPAVLNHGEVFEDHLVLDRDDLTVIDWEHAIEHGFPLWDLAFYATNVLAAVDDAGDRQRRDEYAIELFSGTAPASPVLFQWMRRQIEVLHLPPETVGALVTLYWLHRSELSRQEREMAERAQGGSVAPSWLERTAGRWLKHPQLAQDWSLWMERA